MKLSNKIVGLAAAAVLLGTGTVSAQDTIALPVISSLPSAGAAVTYTVVARDLDAAHGLDVEITQSGGSSTLQIDAVLAGSSTFGHPGSATALQAIREGAEITIIGAIAKNQITAVISNAALAKVGVSPDAPIEERIRALKGMTIGTNPEGSTYTQMLRYYLKQYGLDPDNDVRLVGMTDSSALISGIEQERFDVIVSASGVVEQAMALDAGELWFAGARGDIPGGETSVVVAVVTRNDTIANNPELVDKYRAALADALTAVNEDHEETGRILREQYFQAMDETVWNTVWDNATAAFPTSVSFTKDTYDFWIGIDPKGPESYSNVDYSTIVYPAAQGN